MSDEIELKPSRVMSLMSERDVWSLLNERDHLRVENARLESACTELKAFIANCEMPMHTSFSDADSIAWRKKREYLLSNKAGEKLIERLKELELIAASVPEEDPTLKYLEEKLYTKGEHSLCETIDNVVWRINKAKDLVQRFIDTGLLRTDETRQLWDEANEFLKL